MIKTSSLINGLIYSLLISGYLKMKQGKTIYFDYGKHLSAWFIIDFYTKEYPYEQFVFKIINKNSSPLSLNFLICKII